MLIKSNCRTNNPYLHYFFSNKKNLNIPIDDEQIQSIIYLFSTRVFIAPIIIFASADKEGFMILCCCYLWSDGSI